MKIEVLTGEVKCLRPHRGKVQDMNSSRPGSQSSWTPRGVGEQLPLFRGPRPLTSIQPHCSLQRKVRPRKHPAIPQQDRDTDRPTADLASLDSHNNPESKHYLFHGQGTLSLQKVKDCKRQSTVWT